MLAALEENSSRVLIFALIILSDLVEEDIARSLSLLRDCDGSATVYRRHAEATRGQNKKKRDKQEVGRQGRDERSRLPSETFSSYIPRETPFLQLLYTWSQLPRHISIYIYIYIYIYNGKYNGEIHPCEKNLLKSLLYHMVLGNRGTQRTMRRFDHVECRHTNPRS